MLIPKMYIERLQWLRDRFGPMPVTSGYRCPNYNEKVSKTGRTGPHTKAAFDIAVAGERAMRLVKMAAEDGWTGIGVNQKGPHDQRFIHLDQLPNKEGQPRPWMWSY